MRDSEQGVCEVFAGEGVDPLRRTCELPAVLRYPAMGGGFMRLCAEHGEKHRAYCDEWIGNEWEINSRRLTQTG